MRLPVKTILPTSGKHTASVIFFHGSGDSGANLAEWVKFLLGKDMEFQHIRVIYPTAPLQPYTPNGGSPSNVWFDRRSVNIASLESRKSLAKSYEIAHELIEQEISSGIPLERIIVGGFSMGGALALHTGYHLHTKLAGVFACSSFLNRESVVYESLLENNDVSSTPELLMFHGERDTVVPIEWGQETFDNLVGLGVKCTFTKLRNTLHELKKQEIFLLKDWILKKLPLEEKAVNHKL